MNAERRVKILEVETKTHVKLRLYGLEIVSKKQTENLEVYIKTTSYFESEQWRSGAAGNKLEESSLLFICEAFQDGPEIQDYFMVCRVPS